ncbi:Carbon monoxide dehydrogenase large chain [Methylobacterium crusticola]|uniref:Carbon monoxide dehydrogenase large chain n=1 Tax=Methylobacterium crusticola TaxID=1697972 RepID=A0ABQ4QWG4_9HYPH|nr:xanthine dehydrogenase family protein molybdopterin-binding subunit [Methylobacterium crusticola]GJD49703.1 Carbon monoxide dehydrogenase large chain [Methylobacterium crusticola]
MTFWHSDLTAHARDEDAFLQGAGRYVDDIRLEGQAHGYVLRSPHAHARIRSIDTARARRVSGVLAVLTGADVAGMVQPLGCVMPLTSRDGTPRVEADRAILAIDRVRHVGDGVAFVVAGTLLEAAAAAELVQVDYEVLPAVAEPGKRAVPIWPEAPDNVCFDWQFGDEDACSHLLAQAAHVARITLRSPRVVAVPVEPRAALGVYDSAADEYTLVSNTQGVHFVRRVLAKAFDLPAEKLRVVTPHVGGGFGSKIFAYPEQALVLAAARITGRPVRWTSTRTEAFLSDTQARDHHTEAALALDAEGRFLALSVQSTVNLGAYLSQYTPLTATGVGAPVQAGAYRFRAIAISVRGIFTNTVPVDAYRGAGRPEANYVLERVIDRAAAELGLDPAALRARNLPEAQAERLTAVTGLVIDGGQFADNQRRCLRAADRGSFPLRRAESARRGKLRGFGFANYLESNGGLAVARMIEPDRLPVEGAALTFGPHGELDIVVGTQSTGQDHALPLILHAARSFGLAPEKVVVRQGDTGLLGRGGGTGGSKSLLTSSVALEQAVADVAAKGCALLTREWKAASGEIQFERGLFVLRGSNRVMSVAEVASAFPRSLDGESRGILKHGSCANGCHACEVEIDPDTGEIEVVRYTAVDDFGEVLNEAAVRGQVQGGVAQGLGQALSEHAVYDAVTGQLLTGSLLDYAVPRAAAVPDILWINNGLSSRTNVFGAKACGEAGASAAPPAVMNAVADALSAYAAARSLQMPARAADVWRVIHAAA